MKPSLNKLFTTLTLLLMLHCFYTYASSDKLYYASLDSLDKIDSLSLDKLIKQQILDSLTNESKNKLGNRGKVEIKETNYYRTSDEEGVIEFFALLKYHQYQPATRILGMKIGGGMSIMKYDATIKGRALINSLTCEVNEFEAKVYGDRVGIFEHSEIRMQKDELKPIDLEICNTLTRLDYQSPLIEEQIQ
jgi:hypothetical protein